MRMTSTTCYNCGGLLLEEPLLEYDKKEMLDDADRPSWLEYDGNNYFITCQQCSAMNIVIISEDPDGIPVLTITRAIMDDQ
jgi:hypothetical protein